MKWASLFLMFIFIHPVFSQQQELNKIDSKGKKQGKWVKRDESNQIIYTGFFKDDLPKGTFRYYYPGKDTLLKSVLIHSSDGKSVRAINYHMNRSIMSTGKYVDKLKDSLWIFFHETGYKTAEEFYKKGKRNGLTKVYYENEKILSQYNYKDDKKDGEFKEYFDNGAVKLTGNYKMDNPEGRFTYYFPNGKIVAEGNYLNGSKHLLWMYYKQDGSFESKQIFNKGHLIDGKEAEEFIKKIKSDSKNNTTPTGSNSGKSNNIKKSNPGKTTK